VSMHWKVGGGRVNTVKTLKFAEKNWGVHDLLSSYAGATPASDSLHVHTLYINRSTNRRPTVWLSTVSI